MQNNELEKKSNRLLSCPFCGGEAELFHDEQFIHHAFVFCTKCEAQTRLYANGNMTEKAIKDWNTRKPMERIVEQLEEEIDEAKHYWDDDEYYTGAVSGFQGALEIVKGGVDNAG
jgi:Lar family restriction alleviation protein